MRHSRASKLHHFILDILFPAFCISCDKHGEWLCQKCLNEIQLKQNQSCPICKKVSTPNGEVCFDCKKEYSIDAVLVASLYRNKNKTKTFLAQAIHVYKYNFVKDLGKSLGELMKKIYLQFSLPLPDLIIPVPLHDRRLRWRGFNQSLLIANYLSQELITNLEIETSDKIILRSKHTRPQMTIRNRRERIQNVANVFVFNETEENINLIKNKTILLVDDITTTGSTLFECAKVLKQNGAKKVYGIVLARE